MSSDVTELLKSARYLLHRLDLAQGVATFLPTTRERLEQASFLDGRSPVSDGSPITVPIDRLLRQPRPEGGTDRFLCHVSFCGSTLLARLLDQPLQVFTYKEPHALVDLADGFVSAWLQGRDDERLEPLLAIVLSKLRQGFSSGEVTVVKPTSWINSMLPMIAATSRDFRLICLDMSPKEFLVAVLRGGRERIVYTLRLAAHLQAGQPDTMQLMKAASNTSDAMAGAMRLALVALHLQRRRFDQVDATRSARFSFSELVATPLTVLKGAADSLDVPVDFAIRSMDARSRVHAKAPEVVFDTEMKHTVDMEVKSRYGALVEGALAWAADTLPL